MKTRILSQLSSRWVSGVPRGGRPLRATVPEWEDHPLPFLVPYEPAPSLMPEPSNDPEPSSSGAESHKRVLIVDDDVLVRGSLAAVLSCEGFAVDEAESGFEAVTRAIEHQPDLVLLDLNMPNWDGWTAFSQLRRVAPTLPVIVITARPNQFEKAVKLGVDAFMEKPLNFPILLDAVRDLIKQRSRIKPWQGRKRNRETRWLG